MEPADQDGFARVADIREQFLGELGEVVVLEARVDIEVQRFRQRRDGTLSIPTTARANL